jgi:hypothetical protein
VTPTPCHHDDKIETTIVNERGQARKFHWSRRLPAFAWRLGTEWRRLSYGVTQLLRERFG